MLTNLAFWSWNNKIEKEEIARQIGMFARVGIEGFFIHARAGLKTEYMSEEWLSLVEYAVNCAEKKGLAVFLYDGTVCVTKDGLQTPFEIVAANTLVVKLIGYDPAARYEVTVVCKERTAEEKLFAKITRILQIYEADNAEKDVLLAQCRKQTTCADMLWLIASSWIDGAVKRAIEEPEK